MSYQWGMLLLLVLLCLGGRLQAGPTTEENLLAGPSATNSDPTDVDLSCVEDVEGIWLAALEPWSAVPPEVLQQWNVNKDSALEVTTVGEVLVTMATSESSVTEPSVSVHPEHHTHASPLKITFDGLRKKQLLNPNKDYTVVIESYIGAVSQFLIVVSPYSNNSECGSGGFLPPSLDVENKAWTHTEDELPQQGNSSVEVGSCFFSVQGQLEASDHILLTYTPPECGCVSVRGYIAIVNGNHSEVAGPQEVPEGLDRLLCVDPHPDPMTDNADLVEGEVEMTEVESSTVDPLVEGVDIEGEEMSGLNKLRPRKAQRQANRKIRRKKWRQQMKMKRGRAGWRQFKRQKKQKKQAQATRRQQQGNARPLRPIKGRNNPGPAPWKIVKSKKTWKQKRKQWRQHKKHGKTGKWKKDWHHDHSEDREISDQTVDGHQHYNGTDEIHEEELLIEEELEAENNELVEELLAGTKTEDLTEEGVTEKQVTEENTDENEVDTSGLMSQKGHGKWKAKRRWHKKKSDQVQGVRFCCSQGIRTKKFLLQLPKSENLTASNNTKHIEECNSPETVVTIFASHNFHMNEDICTEKHSMCCNNFTQKRWDQVIAKRQKKKQARKMKRQKAKHARKQTRKQTHKQHGLMHSRHQAKLGKRQQRKQVRKQQRKEKRRNNVE